MAFLIKLLEAGSTIASQNKVLYSVSATASGAIVNNVRFVNTNTSAQVVNLFYKPSGGTQLRIHAATTSIPAKDILVIKPDLTMGPSDILEATTSAAMEFVVCGMEQL